MTGGLMKSTSTYALAAAAGLFVGALAFTPAQAADLGGDCCADLEERVAELEATTVRKGNRVVSVQIYGQVNHALMAWDDGIESDAYIVDNDYSSSRFGLRGSGSIKPGWTAGYRVEFEFQSAASNAVSQDDDDDGNGDPSLRRAAWYIDSQQFGRVTMGQTSGATDDLTLINLGGGMNDPENYFASGFTLRTSGGGFVRSSFQTETFDTVTDADADDDGVFDDARELGVAEGASASTDLTWGDLAPGLDTARGNFVRYDSPSLYGFILSAAWGEDDVWDTALRFSKEWNSIRVAAGIGYLWDGDDNDNEADITEFKGSLSVMHTPSGIYGTFAAGQRESDSFSVNFDDDSGATDTATDANGADPDVDLTVATDLANDLDASQRYSPDDAIYYYGQLGITKNWTGYGATTFYGEYGHYEDFGAQVGFVTALEASGDVDDLLTGSEVTRWGFGAVQAFDSSALEIYGLFTYYEADLDYTDLEAAGELTNDDETDGTSQNVEDWYAFVTGARIKF